MDADKIVVKDDGTKIEFQPMADDPLQFIETISMYKVSFKYKCLFQLISYSIFVILESTILVFILDFKNSESELPIKRYIVTFIFQQPGCFVLFVHPTFIEKTSRFQEYFFKYYCSLNTKYPNFNAKIEKERAIAKFVCFILLALAIASHFTFIIVNDKYVEETICYALEFYRLVIPVYPLLLVFAYVISFALAYAVVYPIWAALYFVLHFKFQLNFLNRYIEENVKNLKYDKRSDKEYQELLSKRLKKCARHHANLKQVYRVQLTKLSNVPMLILCTTGLAAFVAAVYFVIGEINPKFNISMLLALLLCVIQTVISCFYGQLLTNESEKLYQVLLDCPWYYWDKNNRQILLMMLINGKTPFKITCYGLVDLNFQMLLAAIRLSYSLLALAVKFI